MCSLTPRIKYTRIKIYKNKKTAKSPHIWKLNNTRITNSLDQRRYKEYGIS